MSLILPLGMANLVGCEAINPTTDAEHVLKAKNLQNKDDLRGAIIQLKSALEKNPDNPEARRLLGEIYVNIGKGAEAEKELRRASELHVAREALAISLVQALLLQGKFKQAIEEADAPNALPPGQKADLLAYRAEASIGLNKPAQAKLDFEQALALDGKSVVAKLGMARLALYGNDIEKTLQTVKEVTEETPDNAPAWSFLGDVYKTKGDLAQAEAAYTKAIGLRKINYFDMVNRALVRIDLKKTDDAKQDIETLKKEVPNFYLAHFAAGLLNLTERKYPEAQIAFDETIRLNSKYTPAYYTLAVSHLSQKHWNQAEEALSKFLAAAPRSIKGLQMMALLKYQAKNYADAVKYIGPVVKFLPEDIFSLRLLANAEFALGQREQGLAHLKKLAELEPQSAQTQARLGQGLLDMGQTAEALKEFEEASKLDEKLVSADVFKVLAYVRDKRFEQADQAIETVKAKLPNDPLPFDLAGMAYGARADLDKAKLSFEEALKLDPKDLTALNSLAELALRQKNLDEAENLYKRLLEHHPKHVPAYMALAEIRALKGSPQEIEPYLKRAIEQVPDAVRPRTALARLYIRFGQSPKALALLEEARAQHGEDPEFLATLAQAQLENGNAAASLETAKKLTAVSPKSPLSHYLLARAHAQNGDTAHTRAELETSLKLDAKFFDARVAIVRLSAQEHNVDQAKKYLAGLKADYPNNPDVLGLEGWLSMQQRKPNDAVKSYELALEKFPASQLAIELAQAHWQAGNKETALSTLEKWIEKNPNDVAVRYELFRVYYRGLHDAQKGQAQLKAILEIMPDNPMALNELAWTLRKDNPSEALVHAEKAASLDPKSPVIADTLGTILLDRGQQERALSLLKQAYSSLKTNPEVRYHLALAYERNGLKEDAKKLLAELLKDSPSFDEAKSAKELLRRLEHGS